MAYQRIRLTLDINRTTMHKSILETLKRFAYLLGVERYSEAKNCFSGKEASPLIRNAFQDLMDSTLDEPTWKHSEVREGPGYFKLEAAFISTMSYGGAIELLHLLKAHIREPAYSPLLIVHVEGTPCFFVHVINAEGNLDHMFVPFSDGLNLATPQDELVNMVTDSIQLQLKG